jgi:adenosylhomocysteine nucleosidase
MTKPILVLVALEDELPVELPEPYIKIITGLGKVNAAINTTTAIIEYQPAKVINYGTAGTLNPTEYGTGLHRVSCVMQRDIDCTPIGFDIGQTPYDDGDIVINLGVEGPSLSTGDNFVTSEPALLSDLVDMEAYSIVKCCKQFNVPVEIYKYVSDNADNNASEEWNDNISHGYQEFLKVIEC